MLNRVESIFHIRVDTEARCCIHQALGKIPEHAIIYAVMNIEKEREETHDYARKQRHHG